MRQLIKFFEINHKKYLYNGEDFSLFEVDDEQACKEYLAEDDEIISVNENKNEISKIVLNVSNKCNLRCQYCYAQNGNYGRTDALMSKETFHRIVEELVNKGIEKINIFSFFGGEPLLNFELIEYALPILSTKFRVNNFEIVTNGTLFSEDMVKILKEYHVSLSISIDGPENITDQLRGKGVYKKALECINICKKYNYDQLCISATYTKLHEKMGYTYDDICSFLERFLIRMTVSKVLTQNENLKVENKLSKTLFRTDVQKTINNILAKKINAQINHYVYSTFLSLFCSAKSITFCDDLISENSITYDYNGNKYNCFRLWGQKEFVLDNSDTNEKLIRLNDKDKIDICSKCWARNMCKVCMIAIMQEVDSAPFSNNSCVDRDAYEIVLEELIKEVQKGNHEILANNFLKYFLTYQ